MNFRRAVEGVLGLVSCMMLYSCAVDLSVPGETHIRCQSDSDCPSGWLCRSGACVRTEVLNTAPPDLASAPEVTPALGRAGTPFRIALSVTKALLEPPQVTLQAAASIPIECASDDSLAYHCDYVATGDEFGGDDGVVRLDVSLTDETRTTTVRRNAGSFLVDFHPPAVVFATVSYMPPTQSPLSTVTAATRGTTILVTVIASEELASLSEVPDAPLAFAASLGSNDLIFDVSRRASGFAVFTATLGEPPNSGSLPDGEYVPSLTWSDRAGNVATQATFDSPAIVVRTSRPQLDVAQDQVTYLRSPWGAAESESIGQNGYDMASGPVFQLAPEQPLSPDAALPATAFALSDASPITEIRVWSAASNGALLGTVRPEADGSWRREGTTLVPSDSTSVWVTGVDCAGNESAPVEIVHGEWVATPNPRGSELSPHLLFTSPDIVPQLDMDPVMCRPVELFGHDTDAPLAVARAEPFWVKKTPIVSGPTPRAAHVMAYDNARGVTVVFGGNTPTGPGTNDLWEWDGSAWTNKTPVGIKPKARMEHAMAYDSMRNRIVLFGGSCEDETIANDLWEWDGSAWVDLTPRGMPVNPPDGSWPPGRAGHAMAYDSGRGRLVVFGGYEVGTDGFARGVWEWDGHSWLHKAVDAPLPAPRSEAAMAYDPGLGRVILFGGDSWDSGSNTATYYADVWEWDGTDWHDGTPASGVAPDPRYSPGMFFDAGRGRIRVTGGLYWDSSTSTASYFGDLWEWNGQGPSWQQVTDLAITPQKRSGQAMAYDTARREAVLFGGAYWDSSTPTTYFDSTWLLKGSTWTELSVSPGQMYLQAMAFDSSRGRTVMFGGNWNDGGGADHPGVYEWDGEAWSYQETDPEPGTRTQAGMAYDTGRKVSVLFGGLMPAHWDDAWDWTGSAWIPALTSTPWPDARATPAMASAGTAGVWLFGGSTESGLLNDLWTWNGTDWSQLEPASDDPPVRRWLHAIAYDAAHGQLVLFGGRDDQGSPPYGDTWLWETDHWTQVTQPDGVDWPARRSALALAYDSNRERVMLFGGWEHNAGPGGNGLFYRDLWEWDGSSWIEIKKQPDPLPPLPAVLWPNARFNHAMVYDDVRGRLVMTGGIEDVGQPSTDVWEFNLDPARRPAVRFVVDLNDAGIELPSVSSIELRSRAGGVGGATLGAVVWGWQTCGSGLGPGEWRQLEGNGVGTAPEAIVSSEALIDWQSLSLSDIQCLYLERDRLLVFELRPVGISEAGAAQVAVQSIELRVRYQSP